MITSVVLLIFGFGLPYGYYYFTKNPQFGGKLSKEEKVYLKKSGNWKNGIFQNSSKTTMDMNLASMPSLIKESITGRKTRNPQNEIPIEPFDKEMFLKDNTPKFIWFGHSSVLLQLDGKNLLIDPMFGPDASPVGPIRTKRFSKKHIGYFKRPTQNRCSSAYA